METWWNTQNPEEVYYIATFDWSGIGVDMPFATEVYNYYNDFGNGYVPFFGVIGASNVLMHGSNEWQSATNAVPDAIASFSGINVVNPIADIELGFGETTTVDVSNVFEHADGIEFTITIDEVANPSICDVILDGDILTITANSVMNATDITILATGIDDATGTEVFNVNVISPNSISVTFNLFDSYGDGWSYGGNTNFIQLNSYYITLESGSEGTETIYLLPGEYTYTYTATDYYGSENSWTITLEDGTELGSGQGGDNGTYTYSFTLEGSEEPIIYGDVDGSGEVTAYDASLALQYSVEILDLTPEQIVLADVDGNGIVQAYDASLILMYAVGIINEFPIEGRIRTIQMLDAKHSKK